MMRDNGLCTSSKKWIKMIMKTPICFNNKGNEVIALCLFNIWLCLLLSNHHSCMCYHRQCLLHYICPSRVNNDNIYQRPKMSLVISICICCWVCQGKMWETSFWTCVPLSKTITAIVFQSVSWVIMRSPLQGHWNKWVFRSSMV